MPPQIRISIVRWSMDSVDHFATLLSEVERVACLEATRQIGTRDVPCVIVADRLCAVTSPVFRVPVTDTVSLISVGLDQTAVVLGVLSDPIDVFDPHSWDRYLQLGGVLDSELVAYDVERDQVDVDARRGRAVERVRAVEHLGDAVYRSAMRLALACGAGPELEGIVRLRARRDSALEKERALAAKHAAGSSIPTLRPGMKPLGRTN